MTFVYEGNMNEAIRKLQAQIDIEKHKIASCHHQWKASFFNPEKVREGYGFVTVGRGSDMWHEYAGYHDVEKPRWTRICRLCDKEDHTYEQVPVKPIAYEPKFR